MAQGQTIQETVVRAFASLAQKAADAEDSGDAERFSMAAKNLMEALAWSTAPAQPH